VLVVIVMGQELVRILEFLVNLSHKVIKFRLTCVSLKRFVQNLVILLGCKAQKKVGHGLICRSQVDEYLQLLNSLLK
jgi:hypothetical protein